MPEIENEVIFEVPVTSLYFATQCNGDKLVLSNLELTQQQATSLAWLVNAKPDTTKLEIQIKLVGD